MITVRKSLCVGVFIFLTPGSRFPTFISSDPYEIPRFSRTLYKDSWRGVYDGYHDRSRDDRLSLHYALRMYYSVKTHRCDYFFHLSLSSLIRGQNKLSYTGFIKVKLYIN